MRVLPQGGVIFIHLQVRTAVTTAMHTCKLNGGNLLSSNRIIYNSDTVEVYFFATKYVNKDNCLRINPYHAKLFYFNFQPLQVVSRYRDPQPQVVENYSYNLLNLRPKMCKY